MHVPLVAAVVGEEVVDDAVEARPVRSVISVSGLRAGDGDVPSGSPSTHGVAHALLVGAREA
jgi:hypothetical protein